MDITIDEKGIIFRIRKTYSPGMDALALYESTRGVWRLGAHRKESIYGFAVNDGKILEIYNIDSWLPAGTLSYQTRSSKEFERSRRSFKAEWQMRG